jgi:hypothetical protein
MDFSDKFDFDGFTKGVPESEKERGKKEGLALTARLKESERDTVGLVALKESLAAMSGFGNAPSSLSAVFAKGVVMFHSARMFGLKFEDVAGEVMRALSVAYDTEEGRG